MFCLFVTSRLRNRSCCCVFFFALLFSCGLRAQYLAKRQYLSVDGLPSAEVYHAIQDKNGYMWFATDAGVSRFDGYSFANYSTDNGLSENVIFQLIEDAQQRIWCRGMMGTICYFSEGAFHPIPVSADLRRAFNGDLSNGMGVDPDKTIWLSGTTHLFRIPPPYTAYSEVIAPNQYQLHLSGSTVGTRLPDKDPFTVLDEHSKRYALPWLDTASSRPDWTSRFHNWHRDTLNGRLLFAAFNCLFVLQDGQVKCVYKTNTPILDIENDQQGRTWVSVSNKGIVVLSASDFSVEEELQFPVTVSLATIYRDNSNGMWLTSLGNGVYYIPDLYHRQFAMPPPYNPRISNLALIGGRLYGSAYGNVFFSVDSSGKQLPEIVQLPGHHTLGSIAAIGNRLLAIGGATYFFDPAAGAFTSLTDKAIKYGATSSDGSVYVSGLQMLFRVDAQQRMTLLQRIPHQRIQCLYGGQGDTVWIGCSGGLFSFQKDTLIEWDLHAAKTGPLRIDAITQLANGMLVLATQSAGLLLFTHSGSRAFSQKDGLPSNLCRTLLALPGTNAAWVGTNNGICLLDCNGAPCVRRVMHSAGGLPLGEIRQMCFSPGKLWVASDLGAIMIDTSFCELHYTFPLYLTSVEVNAGPLLSFAAREFPCDSNTVAIRFTGLWYRNAGTIEYRYRLLGLDTHWVKTHERIVRFQSLPDGDYTFEVQAFSADGFSYSAPRRFHFIVHPPFWKRWWFMGGSGFLLAASGFYWSRSRITRARKEAGFRQHLAETELKALRAQMNPHFVFNALNSIQHLMRTGERETAGKYLADFSSLLRNVLEQSRSEMITVQHELDTLRLYLGIEQLRFGSRFSWQIETSPGLDSERTLIPPMLLQPFVENALRHGLPGRDGGNICISLHHAGTCLTCVIEDNGIGRAAAALNRRQDGKHRSHGLQIVRDRLEMMKQRYNEDYDFSLDDIVDSQGQAAGTRVTLRLVSHQLAHA